MWTRRQFVVERPDLAFHRFHQLLADGQAQARAANRRLVVPSA